MQDLKESPASLLIKVYLNWLNILQLINQFDN